MIVLAFSRRTREKLAISPDSNPMQAARTFTRWLFAGSAPEVPRGVQGPAAHRKAIATKPKKKRVVPGQPVQKKDGLSNRVKFSQAHRYLVWNKDIGKRFAEGPCACCGVDVNFQDYEIGHVKSLAKGGSNDVTNLVVLCRTCNHSMGTMDVAEFRKKLLGTSCPRHIPRGAATPRKAPPALPGWVWMER